MFPAHARVHDGRDITRRDDELLAVSQNSPDEILHIETTFTCNAVSALNSSDFLCASSTLFVCEPVP